MAERYDGGASFRDASSSSDNDLLSPTKYGPTVAMLAQDQEWPRTYEYIHLRHAHSSPTSRQPNGESSPHSSSEGVWRQNLDQRKRVLASVSPQKSISKETGARPMQDGNREERPGLDALKTAWADASKGADYYSGDAMSDAEADEESNSMEYRRQQLQSYTSRLWKTLDEICKHSTLSSDELSEITGRIAKLKAMNEELNAAEGNMDTLRAILAYESSVYLRKLKSIEGVLVRGNPDDDEYGLDKAEPLPSQDQGSQEITFWRNACEMLYEDAGGMSFLQAAAEGDEGTKTQNLDMTGRRVTGA